MRTLAELEKPFPALTGFIKQNEVSSNNGARSMAANPAPKKENEVSPLQVKFDIFNGKFEILPNTSFLTETEKKVLLLKLKGKSSEEIARALEYSISTVKNRFSSIYLKWGIRNQADLTVKAFRANIVPIPELKEAIGYDSKKLDKLGKRQLEILSLFAEGLTLTEAAQRLNLAESTVKNVNGNIRRKLNISTQVGAITAFLIKTQEKEETTQRTKTELTRRENEVLNLVLQGKNNTKIAEILTISKHTAKQHISHICEKLGVKGRKGLLAQQERNQINLTGLTQKENEVLNLMAEGLTNKKIAARLGSSTNTVKSQVTSILNKLDARTRFEAVAKASQKSKRKE